MEGILTVQNLLYCGIVEPKKMGMPYRVTWSIHEQHSTKHGATIINHEVIVPTQNKLALVERPSTLYIVKHGVSSHFGTYFKELKNRTSNY